MGLSESTRSSSYFEYSLKLYLALWQWANAFKSIRYTVESEWYGFIDLEVPWLLMEVWIWRRWFWNILDVASYIWDVCEAFWLPLASMWDTPALWGQCLRIVFDLWVFELCDLCICDLLLRFGYCSANYFSYDCWWLDISWEVEQNILLLAGYLRLDENQFDLRTFGNVSDVLWLGDLYITAV